MNDSDLVQLNGLTARLRRMRREYNTSRSSILYFEITDLRKYLADTYDYVAPETTRRPPPPPIVA